MNCRQAKADIALWIGEDLPDRSRREELRRHVSACSGCRTHYKQLKGTLQVLEHADREQTYDVSDSVWPELARRIEQQSQPGSRPARFNGWLPFVAMTAACVALVVVMETQGPRARNLGSDPVRTGVFDFSPLLPGSPELDLPQQPPAGGNKTAAPIEDLSGATDPQHSAAETGGRGLRRASTVDSF
jgi:hypothetical protein